MSKIRHASLRIIREAGTVCLLNCFNNHHDIFPPRVQVAIRRSRLVSSRNSIHRALETKAFSQIPRKSVKMHFPTTLSILAFLATTSLVTALPATNPAYAAPPHALPTAKPGEFFLVTADQSERSSNTSALRGVSATTPFVRVPPPSQSHLPSSHSNHVIPIILTNPTARRPSKLNSCPTTASSRLQHSPCFQSHSLQHALHVSLHGSWGLQV